MLAHAEPSILTSSPLPGKEFILARHGQTDWNVEGRIQGHTDTPLNATGWQQARDLAQRLESHGVTLIVTSPLKRALYTAEVVSQHLGVSCCIDPDLKERSFGSFEGRLRSEIEREQNLAPGSSMTYMDFPPDAETASALEQRALRCISKWLTRYPDENLLFINHGAFFRALHASLDIVHTTSVHNAHPYHFIPSSRGWSLTE
ncbi:MAG: histidine phosphatase family protein [Pseudomonas fluorescens]|nr:MAG: histidine phosphatase family protein [Pseudomonas fluorescens]